MLATVSFLSLMSAIYLSDVRNISHLPLRFIIIWFSFDRIHLETVASLECCLLGMLVKAFVCVATLYY